MGVPGLGSSTARAQLRLSASRSQVDAERYGDAIDVTVGDVPVNGRDATDRVHGFADLGGGRLLSRFFFPVGSGTAEDPATGSATANLGGWLIAMQRPLPISYTISQGEYADRPATLFLDVDQSGRIFVSGDVIELGSGSLRL